MTEYADSFDLEVFKGLARDWRASRDLTSKLKSDDPKLVLLASLAERRPVWELMLTSIAYLTGDTFGAYEHLDPLVQQGKLEALLHDEFTMSEAPSFAEVAGNVSTLPRAEMLAGIEHLIELLGNASAEDFGVSMSALYCLQRYPDGGPEFIRCIRGE